MGFKIDFIGLVCFVDRGDTRLAYFPDGRAVDGIAPHIARIIVPSASVAASSWWEGEEFDFDDGEIRIFFVPEPVILKVSGLLGRGVDATQHDEQTPRLSADGSLEVDEENAETIVRLTIREGTLTAFALQDGLVSQLTLPDHDGEIEIVATAQGRSITLKPGAEIVMRNTSNDVDGGDGPTAHFRIYRKLAPNSAGEVTAPDPNFAELRVLTFDNPALRPRDGGNPGRNCSNVAAR